MRTETEELGKASVTVEKNYHSSEHEYDKLTIVEEEGAFKTYISRKPVPIGTELTNREYWIPFSGVLESIVFDYLKFKQDYAFGYNLEDNSIKERHILDGTIIETKIADKNVTNRKIADNTIEIEKLSATLRETIKAATGVPEDLANDITKLMRKVFPLDIIVNITPTALQEKGTSTEITITWDAKVEDETVNPDSVFVNGHDVTEQTSYKETVSDSKNFTVEVTAEGRITSVNKSITYVYPIFTGFASDNPTVSNLVKQELRTSLGTLIVTHTNYDNTKHFYIFSPYQVHKVTTSGINIFEDFENTTIEIMNTTYYIYRLSKASSINTFTFEIS